MSLHHLYCTDNGLVRYLIRRTLGGFLVGLVFAFGVRPLVAFVRRSFGA